jgi:hypothetical protein
VDAPDGVSEHGSLSGQNNVDGNPNWGDVGGKKACIGYVYTGFIWIDQLVD